MQPFPWCGPIINRDPLRLLAIPRNHMARSEAVQVVQAVHLRRGSGNQALDEHSGDCNYDAFRCNGGGLCLINYRTNLVQFPSLCKSHETVLDLCNEGSLITSR
jgi:hypothetical protein